MSNNEPPLEKVIACRLLVEDYSKRLNDAATEYYSSGKTLFPNLTRAEDEEIHKNCEIILLELKTFIPDALDRWNSIKYPYDQYSEQVLRMNDYWIRGKILFQNIESTLRIRLESNTHIELSKKDYYDLAISFAGEDRKIAEKIADKLRTLGYKIFYDKYEQADLWGKDLYSHLSEVYGKKAKYCLMIISSNYAVKHWTNHERVAAQARAFEENKEYILPLRLDETEIPGLSNTVAYVDYKRTKFYETILLLASKLSK
jgi:hypothetical protein